VDGRGRAVLTGFGSARVIGDPTCSDMLLVGTAEYWAPELLPQIDMDVNELFSKKSDVYALGILCFEVSHTNNGHS
jgi:serine/threonine protein kinase